MDVQEMSTGAKLPSEIGQDSFPIMETWYQEWVKINKYVFSTSFAVIGFGIALMRMDSDGNLGGDIFAILRSSWLALFMGSALAGLSIVVAYIWFDNVVKIVMREQSGEFAKLFVVKGSVRSMLRLARVAVGLTVASGLFLFAGVALLIRFAWFFTQCRKVESHVGA